MSDLSAYVYENEAEAWNVRACQAHVRDAMHHDLRVHHPYRVR